MMPAWEKFLTLQEKEIGAATVLQWLRPLKVTHFDAGNLYLEAYDAFQLIWFEEHIRKKIKTSFFNQNNRPIKVHLTVNGQENASPKRKKSKLAELLPPSALTFDELNPHNSFINLHLTQSHHLTTQLLFQLTGLDKTGKKIIHAPALSQFNPIYLYGPQGSSKTHLLQATANALKEQNLSVIYARAETFTEHVVTAIRAGEMSTFRNAYRNVDVLIIDDIHLLSKKWATQEELFHTFSALHLSNRQIILSANCMPNELQQIEPRLVSRFEWGILLPLPQATKEELKQILIAKTHALNFPLTSSVIDFLIHAFSNSTSSLCRALEALILRVHLKQCQLSSTQITTSFIEHHLEDLLEEEKRSALSPEKVVLQCAEQAGIKPEDILGKGKNREYALPRQIAMYICRTKLAMPFTHIGDFFLRDHSTVMSSVKRIQGGIDKNDADITLFVHAVLKALRT